MPVAPIRATSKQTAQAPDLPRRFRFYCPASAFKKSGGDGQVPKMRIAGIISTDRLDLQNERVIQTGLDLSYLVGGRGTFNNEHEPGHHNVLGIPDSVQRFDKGDLLPDGQVAATNCTWAEGSLLNEPDGIKTFEKARALQELGRGLGFSIEGIVTKRAGADGNIIAQAKVNHVAICHQPVNTDTGLTALLRSLQAVDKQKKKAARSGKRKALTVTDPSGPRGISPLVYQDKRPPIVDLLDPGEDKPAAKRRSSDAPKKSGRGIARKSHPSPELIQAVFRAFPSVGVDYAVHLANALTHRP